MAVLFTDTVVTSDSPGMVAKADYSYSRNGVTQTYTLTLSIRTDSNGGWWNNVWAVRVWMNNIEVAHNWIIKPQTSGTIGKNWYSQTSSFSIDIGEIASGTIPLSINFYDPGYSGNIDSQGGYCGNISTNMNINPLPILELSPNNRTFNSITLEYSATNITPELIRVYDGNDFLGVFNSSPFTITGLNPKTNYDEIYAYGYANGAFGPKSNEISETTYPATVSINNLSIDSITPFEARANVVSSSQTDTDLIEYTLCDINNQPLLDPYYSTSFSYNFNNLTPETTYKVRVRLRTYGSNAWSNYNYVTFMTLADQASIFFKENSWKKGKVYMKINSNWVPAKKVYVKNSNTWKGNTNF